MRSLGVIGLGLIGGSFARALAQTGARVIGFDLCPQTTDMAAKAGIIEKAASPQEACLADDIFIAVPVGSFGQVLDQIADCISPASVIFDGGSCKQNAVAAAAKLGAKRRRFVPSHPIAGREDSGFAASSADLFRGQWTVICTTDADEDAVQATRGIWQKTGAKIAEMSAAEHDEIFAAVSHLPHFLSFALVESMRARPDCGRYLRYAAGGFRDFTRIAASHPEMWRDICLANADALLTSLADFRRELDSLEEAVKAKDAACLHDKFSAARRLRRDWAANL